jgi:hypothetical protein
VGSALNTVHTLKMPQLLSRGGSRRLPPQRRGAIQHEKLLRREGNEGALWRGKAGGVKHAVANLGDFASAPIIPAMVFG